MAGNGGAQKQDGPPPAVQKCERQEGWSRGPRSLFLRRCDNNGFGFTLRHFIVYPPESYTVLQGDRHLGLRYGRGGQGPGSAALDEPMDTIFVKNVRENSSAHAAGLATGDRIIGVNGETITGRTYAQVVQLIQQSGNFLHLLVVPKEDDILQLYFGETAHNPETNQRPSRMKSPDVSSQHHRSMLRHQSPVPFSSLHSTTSQQQQHASSLPLPHHLHHRHHLASQTQAKSRSLFPSGAYLNEMQGVNTATFPQTGRSPSSWSSQGNAESLGHMKSYHGAGGQEPNFHSQTKTRRNSEGTRESVYVYGESGKRNPYYNVPGSERRVSSDNSVWDKGPNSGAYKLRQSEDVMGSAGGGLTYQNYDSGKSVFLGQHFDSGTTNATFGSSENVNSNANSLQGIYYPSSAGCRLSLDAGTSRRESSISLPSNGLVRDNFTVSDGSKDSLISYDSSSTLTGGGQDHCSSDDSLIMSRIRKSCEQKEEFLRRPNQPISWNMTATSQPSQQNTSQSAIIAREFYARPQKFQKPLWPPPNAVSSSSSPILYRQQSPPRTTTSTKSNYASSSATKPTHQNLQRVKSDIDSERDSQPSRGSSEERRHERALSEPWDDQRREFLCGGPVTNVPNTALNKSMYSHHLGSQFRPINPVLPGSTAAGSLRQTGAAKSPFISTLSRIHENIPASDPGELSSGNYASSAYSDGTGSGSSSLPTSLPSSPSITTSVTTEKAGQCSRSLTSTHEEKNSNHQLAPNHPVLQLVHRRARQFETGRLDEEEGLGDRTSLYRSELSRLSSKRSVPNVAVRKREFESRSTSGSGGARDGRRMNRESRSLESAVTHSRKSGSSSASSSGLSGNRLIPIGGKQLHCEPPRDFSQHRTEPPHSENHEEPVHLRARSNSADSWAAAVGASSRHGALEWASRDEDEPQRHKAVRQDSYLAAVRTPVSADGMGKRLKSQNACTKDGQEESKSPNASVSPAVRPTQLEIPNPIRPADPQSAPVTSSPVGERGVEDGVMGGSHDGISKLMAALNGISPVPVSTVPITLSSDSNNVVTTASSDTTGVVRRQKTSALSDEERLVRRVSYLKATWGDRMHVDSDLDLSDSELQPVQHHSGHRRWRPPLFPDDIQRLIGVFEEASQTSHPKAAKHPQCSIDGSQPSTIQSVPAESNKENQREGWLHCKITLVDGKKAGDRSWKQVWAVLRGHNLYLYKDRQQQQQQTPLNVSESVSEQQQQHPHTTSSAVDIRCSQVDVAGDYTKKKHVLRLNTLSGSELLLQAEDASDMAQWIRALQEQSGAADKEDNNAKQQSAPQSAGSNSRLSPLPAHKGIRKLTSFRNRSPTGQSPVNKTRKPSQTDQIPSPKTKTWKGRVAKQFRRIQQGAGSPSSPTAPQPEGVTIGIPLEDCPQSSFSEFVPLLVELCTNIVEARGLDIIGIYRVPGNTAAVSSLTEGVNKGFETIDLQDPRWNDVNVISSLLKLFFRKLPDALLTSELYPLFIEADKIEDSGKRILTIRKLLHSLPDHHYETLKFLLFHLKKVVEHSSMNKMEARNLAIVFGPTLVRTADDNMVTMVTDMSHQCRIVESLISHVDWFFSDDDSEEHFPFTVPQDTAELEAASANHNLLLSNIQKVEGMKADSPNKDISAKDIVSSIISAANRKMQKAKSRKGAPSSASGASTEDSKDTLQEAREAMEGKLATEQKLMKTREPSSPAEESEENTASNVASSIYDSVVFSGNIVKNIHAGEEAGAHGLEKEFSTDSNKSEAHSQEFDEASENHLDPNSKLEGSEKCTQMLQPWRRDGSIMAGSDEVAIRTYAGLSATTQERIRRFERETKAMLQRDLTRQRRESEWREAEKRRIDMELQQAKRDMENEDLLDEIADNPSDIKKKITDMSSMLDNKKYSGNENSRFTHRLSSSSLITSSSSNVTSTKSDPSATEAHSRDQSPYSRRYTQTKKVGTTHVASKSIAAPGGISSSATDSSGTSHLPVKMSVASSNAGVSERSSRPQSSAVSTRPPTARPMSPQSNVAQIRRGSSVENLQAAATQNTASDMPQQKTSPPNGTLKRLKTGKEKLDLAPPVLSPQPPSPLIGSLRCGSLDSLQDTYSSERPQSDISDDGSDLLASLTSTFDRKLKSLLSTTTTMVEGTMSSEETKLTACTPSTTYDSIKLPEKKESSENIKGERYKPDRSSFSTTSESSEEVLAAAHISRETSKSSALFRDPSLHRRKSASLLDRHKVDVKDNNKNAEEYVRSKLSDTSTPNRKSCPPAEQKAVFNSKNSEKSSEKDDAATPKLKAADSPQSKPSDAVTRSHKEEGNVSNTRIRRSESLTKADKSEAIAVNTKLKRSESLTKAEKGGELATCNSKLKRSESLTKAERMEMASTRLRRSESLTKAERCESPFNSKLKRSDSLTKTEKTESNISKRRQQEMLMSSGIRVSYRGMKEKENIATIITKLKRKNGMPERSIKRRHTVGGTKDFDKLHWLDNRLQHEQLAENEAVNTMAMAAINNKERRCLRTSSPDLSSSRLSGVFARDGFLIEISLLGSGGIMAELRQHISPIGGRPHSLPDPNLASRVFKVPLESHV